METHELNEESSETSRGGISGLKWLLVLFPGGIFILGFVSVVYYLNGGFEEEEVKLRGQRAVSAQVMAQMLERIENYAPERGLESPEGRRGLRRLMTMYGSSMGRRNAGFDLVETEAIPHEGELWSAQLIEIPPKRDGGGYLLLLADASQGTRSTATLIASMEASAKVREAELGLLVALLPCGPEGAIGNALEESLLDWLGEREVCQRLVLGELGRGLELVYTGDKASELALSSALTEAGTRLPGAPAWVGFGPESPLLYVVSQGQEGLNDEVSQARVAGQLEALIRGLIRP